GRRPTTAVTSPACSPAARWPPRRAFRQRGLRAACSSNHKAVTPATTRGAARFLRRPPVGRLRRGEALPCAGGPGGSSPRRQTAASSRGGVTEGRSPSVHGGSRGVVPPEIELPRRK